VVGAETIISWPEVETKNLSIVNKSNLESVKRMK